jgi:hypothetical protein
MNREEAVKYLKDLGLRAAPIDDTWGIMHDTGFVEVWPTLKQAADRAADYVAFWEDGIEARKAAAEHYRKKDWYKYEPASTKNENP